jgi:transposase-like protein
MMFKGRHFDRSVILVCILWYWPAHLSLRDLKVIRIRKSQYLNNRIKQDHGHIKRRVRSMLGFKSLRAATVTLAGIEMVHMMRKHQGHFAFNPKSSLKEQFEAIAA